MRRRSYLLLWALMLVGCTDSGMQAAIGPLVGQNVRFVYDRWGPPTLAAKAFGSTIYTWQWGTMRGDCTVDLFVSDDNTIESWDSRGTTGERSLCAQMAAQLRTGIGFVDHSGLR
jgi:hypothetical protein